MVVKTEHVHHYLNQSIISPAHNHNLTLSRLKPNLSHTILNHFPHVQYTISLIIISIIEQYSTLDHATASCTSMLFHACETAVNEICLQFFIYTVLTHTHAQHQTVLYYHCLLCLNF